VLLQAVHKISQLILRKISKTGATRCQTLRLKCTKFGFRWGCASDPAEGAYSAPPGPLAAFKEPTSKGRGRKGKAEGRGQEVDGGIWPTPKNFGVAPSMA